MFSIPLIDLHCHLDGAISVEIAKKLSLLQNIKLPSINDEELLSIISVPNECQNLTEFLKRFSFPLSLLQTKAGICEAVKLVQDDMLAQGLIYLELRFAPQLHCQNGLTQKQVIQAALDGLRLSSLHTNLVLCCMRGENKHSENLETVVLAKEFLVEDNGVTAIDLSGAESLFPTEDYKEEFLMATKYKIPFTIHAGEACGPESVWTALKFGAKRIGHGVRCFEDKKLVDYIIKNNIPLEMAPTSNKQTKAVSDMNNYPLKCYLDKGVKVTLNTDDPAICRTTLSYEFDYIKENYGIKKEQIKQILLNSANAAFTNEKTKIQLIDKIKSSII